MDEEKKLSPEQLRQCFVDAEYCIDKYFDEHVKALLDFYARVRHEKHVGALAEGFGMTNAILPSQQYAEDVLQDFASSDVKNVSDELLRDSHDLNYLTGVWAGIIKEKIGEERYNALSAALHDDLAHAYVNYRVYMRMIDYEAEKDPYQGSVDYVLDEAKRHSEVLKALKIPPIYKEIEEQIERRRIEKYDPSLLERRAGKFLGDATDVAFYSALTPATSWAGVAMNVAAEYGIKQLLPEENPAASPNVSMILSCVIFGRYHDELGDYRREAVSVNPYSSALVAAVNENLSHKFMRRRETTDLLPQNARPLGIKSDIDLGPVPDYASQLTDQVDAHFAIEEKFGPRPTPTEQGVPGAATEELLDAEEKKKKGEVAGWGGLLDNLGLGDFGTVGKNLGYVIAMLPDLLIGMFTGKSRHLKLDDNLLPLGSIVAGLFVKNPLLKMLLIGFGGANLLNKAGHEALDIRDGGRRQPVRQYLEYGDEVLDSRIKQPQVRGNTLLATIDNIPSVLTINDEVIDAYEKGLIPLNTLCNAVLRKYDEQKAAVEESFIREDTQEAVVDRSHGLK